MRLSDFEADCLVLNAAGTLAQKRLARGIRLNYPEAVALISSQVRITKIYNNKKFKKFINMKIISI